MINDYSRNALYFPIILLLPKTPKAFTWYFCVKGCREYILGNYNHFYVTLCHFMSATSNTQDTCILDLR